MQRSAQSHTETLTVRAENLLGRWVELAFLFSPLAIYEFLFGALRPFQVGLTFDPFVLVILMNIFSYPP